MNRLLRGLAFAFFLMPLAAVILIADMLRDLTREALRDAFGALIKFVNGVRK